MENTLLYKKDDKDYKYRLIITVDNSTSYYATYVRYNDETNEYCFNDYLFKVFGYSYEEVVNNLKEKYHDCIVVGDIKGNKYYGIPQCEIDVVFQEEYDKYQTERLLQL